MDFEALIRTYGYFALFVGTFLEGETILIIAAVLAHRGYLHAPLVVLIAMLGSIGGDQFAFHLGRSRGKALIARWPRWQARIARARTIFDRHQVLVMLGFRFLYGLRNVTPIVIGMSGVSYRTFLPLNVLGAAVWAGTFTAAGWAFGVAMQGILEDMRKYELWILAGLLVVGSVVVAWRGFRRWRLRIAAEKGAGGSTSG